jgi:hypothetical protein
MKSKLGFDVLGKIWNLSDIDGDGFLDEDEVRACWEDVENIVLSGIWHYPLY